MAKNLSECCNGGYRTPYTHEIEEMGYDEGHLVCTKCHGEIIPHAAAASATHFRFFRAGNALIRFGWTEPKGILVDVRMEQLDGPAPSVLAAASIFDAAFVGEWGEENSLASFPIHEGDLQGNNLSATEGRSGRLDYWAKRTKFEAFGEVFPGGHRHVLHISMEGKLNQGLAAHGEQACGAMAIAMCHVATVARESGNYSTLRVVEIFPEK